MKPNEKRDFRNSGAKGNNERTDGKTSSNSRGRKRRRNNGRNYNSDSRANVDNSAISRGLYAGAEARNDLSWYTKNPDLVAVASRLAAPYRPGNEIKFGKVQYPNNVSASATETTFELTDPVMTVPGVMSIEFVPTVGYSDDTNSPASICAARMWYQIRSKFSSDLSVDPPDMFMYVYGLGQIHAYLAMLQRIYRSINTYSQDNYDFPKNVLRAQLPMMINSEFEAFWTDLVAKRNTLYININEMVNAVNVYRIPDQYPILQRMTWMNQHVYMDENRPNAQCYVFRQQTYFKIDDSGDDGSALIPFNVNLTWKIDDYIEHGWDMIKAMNNWEDSYTINGYIYRAWEGSPALIAPLLGELELLTPVYVPEVLMQIENANLCTLNIHDGVYNVGPITQNPGNGTIYHYPSGPAYSTRTTNILNLHDMVSDAATIIATRLATLPGSTIAGDNRRLICGTEIVTDIRLIFGGAGSAMRDLNLGSETIYVKTNAGYSAAQATNTLDGIKRMLILQYWHHHPTIYALLTYTATSFTNTEAEWWRNANGLVPLCDLDQATVYSDRWLEDLHRVVMYSLFNVFNKDTVIGRNG